VQQLTNNHCKKISAGLGQLASIDSEHKDVPIADAIRASMAFPLFFTPWEIKKCLYADGGEQNNCPSNLFENPPGVFNNEVLTIRLDSLDDIRYFQHNIQPPATPVTNAWQYITANVTAILNI